MRADSILLQGELVQWGGGHLQVRPVHHHHVDGLQVPGTGLLRDRLAELNFLVELGLPISVGVGQDVTRGKINTRLLTARQTQGLTRTCLTG